ncbi:2-phosphoglycolate phosphatase [Cantharellus anzutake]|uniref:2-phosphoglycolate phosphatase n=1 Tax=Cantharellus anzutake TaxID=1750568 RepID=UPI0019077A05|nr:2-phosphoglycolate phosphatase [Cantharellus anzutake]KAF8337033.1 2-phosphoglycolate phosphatase [Cantharellus anzutake]
MPFTKLSGVEELQTLLDSFDTWMFDCDGVIWHGDHLIPGVRQVLALLRSHNKHMIFVTNNATKSRKSYKNKFDKLDVQAEVDEIFGSAYASAVYLSSVVKLPKEKKVYVIGESGLEEELNNEGVAHIGGTSKEDNTFEPFDLHSFKPDPTVGAVLCGLDTKINYTKLAKAQQYLTLNPGCLFLATNEDPTFPVNGGYLPGAGSISAPLRYMLKRDPTAIGKPNSTMLDCVKAKHDFDPQRTIMVGDRLDTDILFGIRGGVSTLLVLTGVTTESDITGPGASPITPDFVTQSLGDLVALIGEENRI